MDLSLHAARPHVDTLLVINRLVSSTAEQLNTFALTCEDKLLRMHHKMQRLETGVQLLEAKLSSLPLDAGGGAPPPPTATAAAAWRRRRRRCSSSAAPGAREARDEAQG